MSELTNSENKELEVVADDLSWLAEVDVQDTLEGMDEYVSVPRVKVIQGTTAEEVKDRFGEGAAVIIPGDLTLSPKKSKGGTGFEFIPLYFWVSYVKISDRDDKESMMILEETFDKNSPLAELARNPDTREEPYGPEITEGKDKGELKFTAKNVERLNFIVRIDSGEHKGIDCGLTFERGEFSHGKRLCSLISMRKAGTRTLPLFGGRYKATPDNRTRGTNTWYGLDVANAETPVISGAMAKELESAHNAFKELHAKKALGIVEDSLSEDDASNVESSGKVSVDDAAF